jgi:hypothetical protein
MPVDRALDAAAEAARSLAGGPVARVERVRGFGRNSGVYRVRAGGTSYALKQYPPPRPGERARAAVEFTALSFMAAHSIAVVPQAFAVDPLNGYVLLEWIAGDPVDAPDLADISSASAFLGAVHALRNESAAVALPPAAEACLSGSEIIAQIERRLARLGEVAAPAEAVAVFIEGTLRPLLNEIAVWVKAAYAAAGLSLGQPVDAAAQTLCPSDFGFHNALRRPSGQLVFIDFDYFGWDDPVKLTADFILHPGMHLAETLKRRFAAAAIAVYCDDPAFRTRLALLYPLFALRWCLILLNEFLPERWANRINAGGQPDWEMAKQRQLDRAREWAQSLAATFQRFPYE